MRLTVEPAHHRATLPPASGSGVVLKLGRGSLRLFSASLGAAAAAVLLEAGSASAHPVCDPGWQFDNVVNHGRGFTVYDRQRDENHTSHRIQASFTAHRGGTYKSQNNIHLDASVEAKIWKIVIAQVHASFDAQVTRVMTASVGNTVRSIVRAHHAVIANYGIFHRSVTGRVYYLTSNCKMQQVNPYATFRLPDEVGWKVFEKKL